MLTEPLEEIYFKWLYAKVASVENPTPTLTFWALLAELHSVEFRTYVLGDDNRAADGLDVRWSFLTAHSEAAPNEFFELGCSILEMLIGFSKVAEFQTDMDSRDWFWIFLSNLGLSHLNDSHRHVLNVQIENVLNVFVERTYSRSGKGGLFPLPRTNRDQRKVEIWYQFCEYLADQELV
jgi:hypothetical protein